MNHDNLDQRVSKLERLVAELAPKPIRLVKVVFMPAHPGKATTWDIRNLNANTGESHGGLTVHQYIDDWITMNPMGQVIINGVDVGR